MAIVCGIRLIEKRQPSMAPAPRSSTRLTVSDTPLTTTEPLKAGISSARAALR
jgi:hypothetical protein